MISYTVYNFLHLFGLVLTTLSLGYSLSALSGEKRPKWIFALHGIGLFLILLGGFGMAARLGFVRDFPIWIQYKIGFWVAVGFLPLILRLTKAKLIWVVSSQILFLLLAAIFGIFKPLV